MPSSPPAPPPSAGTAPPVRFRSHWAGLGSCAGAQHSAARWWRSPPPPRPACAPRLLAGMGGPRFAPCAVVTGCGVGKTPPIGGAACSPSAPRAAAGGRRPGRRVSVPRVPPPPSAPADARDPSTVPPPRPAPPAPPGCPPSAPAGWPRESEGLAAVAVAPARRAVGGSPCQRAAKRARAAPHFPRPQRRQHGPRTAAPDSWPLSALAAELTTQCSSRCRSAASSSARRRTSSAVRMVSCSLRERASAWAWAL